MFICEYIKYIFIYILILNYYLLKTDLILGLVKFLSIPSHMTAPPLLPPKCGMSCAGLSGAPVDAEVAIHSGFWGLSFLCNRSYTT